MPYREITSRRDVAEVTAHAFLSWIQREHGWPACSRASWSDLTCEERCGEMMRAAKELGYAV